MSDATVSLIVAIAGVGGTLASAVISQVLSQRAESRRLDREQQLRAEEQRASESQHKINQLRTCYVQLNAHDRQYRDAMLAYAYALKSGSADAEAAEVSTARRAQRDTRAEAQLVASDAVLAAESGVNDRLTTAYRYLMNVADESDASARRAKISQLIGLLDSIIPQQGRVRALMRLEVHASDELPAWFDSDSQLSTHGRVDADVHG